MSLYEQDVWTHWKSEAVHTERSNSTWDASLSGWHWPKREHAPFWGKYQKETGYTSARNWERWYTQPPWGITSIFVWESCLSSCPCTVTFKCWHWPQWEQYGGLKSQCFSWLINPELHFHAPGDQITPVLRGSKTYVSLSFMCCWQLDVFHC